jgi:hypothetical protein
MAPILLADNVGPGGTAFLIVLALIAVTIGIFFALTGSLRRLKQSVADGKFGPQPGDTTPEGESKDEPVADAAIPDPGGRGGAGA